MKSVFFALLACLAFQPAHAESSVKQTCPIAENGTTVAASGCCSWHDGVCGCSGGDVVCCDGTESPSCSCYRDDTDQIISFETKGEGE